MALGHHEGGAGHEAHGHADGAAEGHDHAAHSHADEGAQEDGQQAHCAPCTACCASASIAAANEVSFLPSASMAPYVFWQSPPFGDRPNALDRPPLAL
jgi:hypothetical protein